MQFWPSDDEHMCSKHVEAWNKTHCEQILCIKLVKYWDKLSSLFIMFENLFYIEEGSIGVLRNSGTPLQKYTMSYQKP